MIELLEGIPILLLIVIGVVAFLIFWKVLKNILKAVFIAVLIMVIIVAGIGIVTFYDIKTMESTAVNDKLMLVKEDGKIISATELKVQENTILKNKIFETVRADRLALINQHYEKGTLHEFYGEDNFIIITTPDYLIQEDNVKGTQLNEFVDLKKEDIENIIRAQTPQEVKNQAILQGQDFYELKSTLTGFVFMKLIQNLDIKILVKEIQKNNIEIYPKLHTAKAISLVPSIILEKTNLI